MTNAIIDLSGYEDSLAFAVKEHNDFMLMRDPKFTPLTVDQYVQALVKRQLDGITQAKTKILEDRTLRAQADAIAKSRFDGNGTSVDLPLRAKI